MVIPFPQDAPPRARVGWRGGEPGASSWTELCGPRRDGQDGGGMERCMPDPVRIDGLYEAHLTVADLDRSIAFYRDVVGLELAHRIAQRHVAFFWIGGRDRS